MDITALASIVLQKFKNAGGYSEMADGVLFKSLFQALDGQYRKHFYITQKRLKSEEERGIIVDKAEYDAAYAEVETLVIAYANKLAATEKSEL